MHWTAIRTPKLVILAHTLGDHSPEEAAQAVDDAGLNSKGGRLIQLTNEEASMLAPWVSMRTTFSRGRVQVGETDQDGARRIFDAIEDQRELRRFHSNGHAPSFALVRFDAEHPAGWVIDPVMPADLEGHLARAVDVEEQDFHAEARDLLRGRLVTIDGMTFVYRLSRPGADVKDVMRDAMEQTNRQIVDELRQALSDAGETLARVTAERDQSLADVAGRDRLVDTLTAQRDEEIHEHRKASAALDDMRRDIRNLRSERDDARRERDEARESRDGCRAAWKRDVAQMRQAHDDFVSAVRTDEKEAHGFLVARGFDGETALDSAKAAVDLYNKMNSMAGEEKGRYAAACQEIKQLRERTMAGVWIVAKAVRERGEVIAVDYFANPLHRSAKAIESWTGEDADEIIRGAMAGNVVKVESRGLAKPETRDLVAVIAPSSEAAVMMARVKLGSAEERLIEEATAATPITAAMVARLKSELDEAKAKCEAAREYGHKLTDAIAAAGVAADLDISGDPEETLRRLAAEAQALTERLDVAWSSALKARAELVGYIYEQAKRAGIQAPDPQPKITVHALAELAIERDKACNIATQHLDNARAVASRAKQEASALRAAIAEAAQRAGVEADADNRVTIMRIADAAIQWGESSAIGKVLANIAAYQGADDPEGYYPKALAECLDWMRANGIRLGRAAVLCDESVAGVFEKIIEAITGEACGSLPANTVDTMRAEVEDAAARANAAREDAELLQREIDKLRDDFAAVAIQRNVNHAKAEALLAALVRAEAAAKK